MPTPFLTPATPQGVLGSRVVRASATPTVATTLMAAGWALTLRTRALAVARDLTVRPARPRPAPRPPAPGLAEAASRALIAVDEDLRGALAELALARAEFGEDAVAYFTRVLDDAGRLLRKACREHHAASLGEPSPDGGTATWDRVLRTCRQVRGDLAREAAAFAGLRDLDGRVAELRAGLGERLKEVRGQVAELPDLLTQGPELAATATRALSTAAAALLAAPDDATGGGPDEDEPLRRQAARAPEPQVRRLREAERAVQQAELGVRHGHALARARQTALAHLPVAGGTDQAGSPSGEFGDPLESLATLLDGPAGLAPDVEALLPVELLVAHARADEAEYLLGTNRARIGVGARVVLTLAHEGLDRAADEEDPHERLDGVRHGRAGAETALRRIRADLAGGGGDLADRFGTGDPGVDAGVQGSLFGDGWTVGASWLERPR